jgi:UDP-N-acetylglucosamine--N-acetylmuramyl-(pentapeptide) pyrophosphoryl-undecaprenol N-acetylglucosamine transferase
VVAFSGGGTGGHLYPALAVADALRVLRPDVRVLFFGSRRGIEGRILSERGEWHVLLPIRGIDRAHPVRSLVGLGGFGASVARALRLLDELRPEAVVVTGGYAGAPAGIAAALSGVPLVLQEQNAVPGLVTRLLSRWATRIHVAFPEAVERLPAGRDRAVVTGNPVRQPTDLGRSGARARLGLPEDGPVLLVVGGSQGARALNEAMLDAVRRASGDPSRRPSGLHVLWATGPTHFDALADTIAEGGLDWVHLVPYIEDMPVALAAADLALARAGATFTAELLVEGLPSVLVPLPTAAEDHQTRNAESLVAAGASVLVRQKDLDGERLWTVLRALIGTPARLDEMSDAARRLARPEAAESIAESVAELLRGAREAA